MALISVLMFLVLTSDSILLIAETRTSCPDCLSGLLMPFCGLTVLLCNKEQWSKIIKYFDKNAAIDTKCKLKHCSTLYITFVRSMASLLFASGCVPYLPRAPDHCVATVDIITSGFGGYLNEKTVQSCIPPVGDNLAEASKRHRGSGNSSRW